MNGYSFGYSHTLINYFHNKLLHVTLRGGSGTGSMIQKLETCKLIPLHFILFWLDDISINKRNIWFIAKLDVSPWLTFHCIFILSYEKSRPMYANILYPTAPKCPCKLFFLKVSFSVLVPIHLGIWNAYHPTNCELRQPSQFFVGSLCQKTWDSTSLSDFAPLPMYMQAH